MNFIRFENSKRKQEAIPGVLKGPAKRASETRTEGPYVNRARSRVIGGTPFYEVP